MSIAIADEHVTLARAVRRFLDERVHGDQARADLDADHAALPDFWGDFARTGWLSIHLPEKYGGEGYTLFEAAIVLEQLGRVAAPGPFLPTLLASALLARSGADDLAAELLPAVVGGTAAAAVAFAPVPPLTGTRPDPGTGSITADGSMRPVPGAALAAWVIVPVACPDRMRWCLLDTLDLTVTETASLDPAWRSATITAGALDVPRHRQLDLTTDDVERLTHTLVAAECAGGAAWCLDTAVDYAKVREQFGRPIGQFQAVKHRCADMLVAVEQARAVAWDAAQAAAAAATGRDRPGDQLAPAIAAAVAPDAYFRVAKDCIQVLGGIGFTWEHDAHRYLRRATTFRQLLGGPSGSRAQVAALALGGARRTLALDLLPEREQVRREIRDLVETLAGLDRSTQRDRLVAAGYFVPHWPPPWGRSADAVDQLIIDEELARGRIRRANLAVGAWAAPTIATHGTAQQQERWVGPTLRGEIRWCQLFSEPGAGSDLAALSTRATPAPGGWILNGQKVWTSLATEAQWGICLARTDGSVPKHLGITYFVVDMQAPGIEIRPLREMTGLAMFNEVFLTDVFVPDDCVVGAVNGGWPLARTTLANERVAMGSGTSFGGGVEALLTLVSSLADEARTPIVLDQVGALVAEAQTVALLGLRSTSRAVSGAAPGPEASVRKLLGAEHDQRTQEMGLALLGPEGATVEGPAAQWTFGFLANRCLTIAGGTSEVQRNVIGERLLGLPRDPEP
ncbi:MAG: acyl-CoA dehydrogenase [Acidimicrobiales bacterium]